MKEFGYSMDGWAYLTRGIIWSQRQVFTRLPTALTAHRVCQPQFRDEAANEVIARTLDAGKPCLIGRFGCVELEAMLRGLDIRSRGNCLMKAAKILTGKSGPFWWDNSIRRNMLRTTGVFPGDDVTLGRFSESALEASRQLDVFASWSAREEFLRRSYFPSAKIIPLEGLDPFFCTHPWTRVLAGKRVLVVHSFAETIRRQYARRQHLFANSEMLPKFELTAYQSVMSYLGLKTPYRDWFEALEKMQRDLSKLDFDVAILGCGAYGLNLGAFIKRDLRRQAVVMGGVSQLLFGIKGGRFDQRPEIAALYNDAWCRADGPERPDNFQQHEGGAYW